MLRSKIMSEDKIVTLFTLATTIPPQDVRDEVDRIIAETGKNKATVKMAFYVALGDKSLDCYTDFDERCRIALSRIKL